MTITLQQAIDIATRAHAGQVDKNGVTPYIDHPLAVMAMVQGEDAKVVAALHDVPEDTNVTLDDLRSAGVTEEQLAAIDAMTHRLTETYRAYVQRALANPLARVVKVADIDHNSDPARLALLPRDVADRLRRKYARVADLIEAARPRPGERSDE